MKQKLKHYFKNNNINNYKYDIFFTPNVGYRIFEHILFFIFLKIIILFNKIFINISKNNLLIIY